MISSVRDLYSASSAFCEASAINTMTNKSAGPNMAGLSPVKGNRYMIVPRNTIPEKPHYRSEHRIRIRHEDHVLMVADCCRVAKDAHAATERFARFRGSSIKWRDR